MIKTVKTTLTALLLIILAAPVFAETPPIGFQNVTVPDTQRPLQMVVWYPTAAATKPELIRDDAVFFGDRKSVV